MQPPDGDISAPTEEKMAALEAFVQEATEAKGIVGGYAAIADQPMAS